jgi:hypothetical protein
MKVKNYVVNAVEPYGSGAVIKILNFFIISQISGVITNIYGRSWMMRGTYTQVKRT